MVKNKVESNYYPIIVSIYSKKQKEGQEQRKERSVDRGIVTKYEEENDGQIIG